MERRGEERCESKVGQMVADNEGIEVQRGEESRCSQTRTQSKGSALSSAPERP